MKYLVIDAVGLVTCLVALCFSQGWHDVAGWATASFFALATLLRDFGDWNVRRSLGG